MGYNLYIGEGKVQVEWEERRAFIDVPGTFHDKAPLNSSDGRNNGCFPSYSAWTNFTEQVGLYEVFYVASRGNKCPETDWWFGESGKRYFGLLWEHPGAAELTEDHYKAFVKAKEAFEQESPRVPDLINQEFGDVADPPLEVTMEYVHRRLDWLIYWTRWALDNCEHPTFRNS